MLRKEHSCLFIPSLKFFDVVLVLEIGSGAHPSMMHVAIGSHLGLVAHGSLVGRNNILGLILGRKKQMRRRLSLCILLVQQPKALSVTCHSITQAFIHLTQGVQCRWHSAYGPRLHYPHRQPKLRVFRPSRDQRRPHGLRPREIWLRYPCARQATWPGCPPR